MSEEKLSWKVDLQPGYCLLRLYSPQETRELFAPAQGASLIHRVTSDKSMPTVCGFLVDCFVPDDLFPNILQPEIGDEWLVKPDVAKLYQVTDTPEEYIIVHVDDLIGAVRRVSDDETEEADHCDGENCKCKGKETPNGDDEKDE